MKTFQIYGQIINDESQRYGAEDLAPAQFAEFAKNLAPGEEVEIDINSPGGDVYGGISIANQIRQLAAEGHATTAVVQGIAASIASVIMAACEKIKMYKSSIVMIHNCWTTVQGNSEALRKEADTMDKINEAILSFYRSKFGLSDEELKRLMDEETWITGGDIETFKLSAEIVDSEEEFNIAAKLANSHFKNMPKELRNLMENKTEDKPVEDKLVITVAEEPDEEKTETGPETEEPEDPDTKEDPEDPEDPEEPDTKEDPEETEDPEEEKVTKAEVEKRVSGMQAKMQGKINDLKADFDARIKEFQNQLKAKDEELQSYKNECISLNSKLETAEKELSEKTSALEAKENALAQLNADVNLPPAEDSLPTFDEGVKACKTPREIVAFIKSGKFKTK